MTFAPFASVASFAVIAPVAAFARLHRLHRLVFAERARTPLDRTQPKGTCR